MENITKQIYEDSLLEIENLYNSNKIYYDILCRWLNNSLDGKKISSYLKFNKLNNIVIYGMGSIGELLYKDLINNKINIPYTLDNSLDSKKINSFNSTNISNIDKSIEVDAIIITPIYIASDIKNNLINIYKNKSVKLLTVDEIIFNM